MRKPGETFWKLFAMLAGNILTWPTGSVILETLHDFATSERFGIALGFLLGAFLFSSKLVQSLTASWQLAWKTIASLLAIALWLFLSAKLALFYETNLAAPDITSDRLTHAKLAIGGLSALWSVLYTYTGGLIAQAALEKKGPPTP